MPMCTLDPRSLLSAVVHTFSSPQERTVPGIPRRLPARRLAMDCHTEPEHVQQRLTEQSPTHQLQHHQQQQLQQQLQQRGSADGEEGAPASRGPAGSPGLVLTRLQTRFQQSSEDLIMIKVRQWWRGPCARCNGLSESSFCRYTVHEYEYARTIFELLLLLY